MKEGWIYKKLGDVFVSINNGANIKQIKGASGIPITRIETLSNDMFNRDRMGYANIDDVFLYTSYVLNEGDILMSHINSMKFLGRAVAYVKKDEETIIHGMNLLRLVPASDVLSPFMVYQFQTKFFRNQILQISHQSVNQASFNTTNLKGLNVIVPPYHEQQSIVDYLDSAFAKIDAMKANAEKALNEAKALFQASLKEMLEPKEGWEEKTIEYFAKIVHGKNQKEVIDDNGLYPIYGSGGNIMGYANSYLCDAGTTILGRKGTIDNPLYIEDKFWNVDTAFGIIAKDNCNKKFLYYSIKKVDWAKRNTGTTLPSLTQSVVYNEEMCAPHLSEQQSIVDYLDSLKSKVDRLQENYDKISQECDALKQAILRQVFE